MYKEKRKRGQAHDDGCATLLMVVLLFALLLGVGLWSGHQATLAGHPPNERNGTWYGWY